MPENPALTPIDTVSGWTSAQLEARVGEARRLYQRVLAGWAGDLLELRRTGTRQPGWPAGAQYGSHGEPFRHAA